MPSEDPYHLAEAIPELANDSTQTVATAQAEKAGKKLKPVDDDAECACKPKLPTKKEKALIKAKNTKNQ